MKGTEGRLLTWLISVCPCLCLPKEDRIGTGCRHSRGGLSSHREQQSWQLCFPAPSALGKSTLGQPCCHLWSFYSRQVIYRNLFVQSQYLPVGAVKIYNSSVLLACCFSVNNGNFHHQEERCGVATRVTLPPVGRRMNSINGYRESACVVQVATGPSCYAVKIKVVRTKKWNSITSLQLKFQSHSWSKAEWPFLQQALCRVCCVSVCACVKVCVYVLLPAFQGKTEIYSRDGGGMVFHKSQHLPSETIRVLYFPLKTAISSTSLIILRW